MEKETRQLLTKLTKEYKKYYREEKEKFVKLNHCFDQCEVYESALKRLLKLVKLPIIGRGSSRIVFRLDENLVLKIAMNLPGLAQNKIEYGLRNSEFVCNTYLKDQRELPAWLVADYCTKAFKKHIKEQFNMTPYQFDTLLYDGKYKLTHGKKFKIRSQNSEKAQKFLKFIIDNDLQPGDLMTHRMINYGINPRGKLVIVDAGLNEKVYNDYY